jgi:UDP-N-acetylglucosamine--N-acetylmuramyl-(pentapeptide) pyrophosphoryl-undecaprenol N-acetylglucosamine transferase
MDERVLFVASTGGHLDQMFHWRQVLVKDGRTKVSWVTFDSPQSRSLLAGEPDVVYIGRVGSRGYAALLRSFLPALRILWTRRPDAVYSTGAGVALAFLPFAWLVGARAVYIESAARTESPSWTGRLLSRLPWIHLRSQYRNWAHGRWHYDGSVFDGYLPVPAATATPIRRLLVTLGTQEGYPFRSLVRRIQAIVPDDVEVWWQIGTDFPTDERPDGAHEMVPQAQLREWIASADAIVAHAGVGSALTLLGSGRIPVLVPRSAARGEHIDEHQRLIARELVDRGLAISADPDALTWDDIVASTKQRVEHAQLGA